MNSNEHFSLCLCDKHMYIFLSGMYLGVEFLHHQLAIYSALVDIAAKCSRVAIYGLSVSV